MKKESNEKNSNCIVGAADDAGRTGRDEGEGLDADASDSAYGADHQPPRDVAADRDEQEAE